MLQTKSHLYSGKGDIPVRGLSLKEVMLKLHLEDEKDYF